MKDEEKEFLRSQRESRGESSMAGINLLTANKVGKQVGRGSQFKRHWERENSNVARLLKGRKSPAKAVAVAAVLCR